MDLKEVVAELARAGDVMALAGFTHLIAAGHETIREGRRDRTLVRMTPDILPDQMIGTDGHVGGDLPKERPSIRAVV